MRAPKMIQALAQTMYKDTDRLIPYNEIDKSTPIKIQRVINEIINSRRYDPVRNETPYKQMEQVRKAFKYLFWVDMIDVDKENTSVLGNFLYLLYTYDEIDDMLDVFEIEKNSTYGIYLDCLNSVLATWYEELVVRQHYANEEQIKEMIMDVKATLDREDPHRWNTLQLFNMCYSACRAINDYGIEMETEGYTQNSVHW